jgi:hypothetical protein
VKQFTVDVHDGSLTLRFWGIKDQPVVSGIEVYEAPKPARNGAGGKKSAESAVAAVADLDRRSPLSRRAARPFRWPSRIRPPQRGRREASVV